MRALGTAAAADRWERSARGVWACRVGHPTSTSADVYALHGHSIARWLRDLQALDNQDRRGRARHAASGRTRIGMAAFRGVQVTLFCRSSCRELE